MIGSSVVCPSQNKTGWLKAVDADSITIVLHQFNHRQVTAVYSTSEWNLTRKAGYFALYPKPR